MLFLAKKGVKTETGTGIVPPANKGQTDYLEENVLIYANTTNGDVYVQNPDGTWPKINRKDGVNGGNTTISVGQKVTYQIINEAAGKCQTISRF